MRFSSVFFLAVVIASASSISATPIDSATPIEAGTEVCNTWCYRDSQCTTCAKHFCVSFSGLCLGFDHITERRDRPFLGAE
ncbi:hypothetical protein C8R48DRAFT_686792 [Suillus tomentosus]|nr:hypothetical protein C8R48DRAFT_686792 [Suillus tomentosus]